jgi:hypothetical protein
VPKVNQIPAKKRRNLKIFAECGKLGEKEVYSFSFMVCSSGPTLTKNPVQFRWTG